MKPPCRFGAACYRRNPSHFDEYQHPKDMESEDASPAKRPRKSQANEENAAADEPKAEEAENPGTSSRLEATEASSKAPTDPQDPEGFHLTKVPGLSSASNAGCVSLGDLLRLEPSQPLLSAVHLTYMAQLDWLREQCPQGRRDAKTLLVTGPNMRAFLHEQRADLGWESVALATAAIPDAFGTHHSKASLLRFPHGIRIAIYTANLVPQDWALKTQGVWLSPLLPVTELAEAETDSPSGFRRDLVAYLAAYRLKQLDSVTAQLLKHDFRPIGAVSLVASVPGRHVGDALRRWGHMRLRSLLPPLPPEWAIVGQFSSIGSLGKSAEAWLTSEFRRSLQGSPSAAGPESAPEIRLVFPCVGDVRESLEGYAAGSSLPYSSQTATKQPWLRRWLHKWRCGKAGRSRASPHVKSYARISPDGKQMGWFLLTSGNLSKAAWGALEKGGSQLHIRSYELGVLWPQKRPVSRLAPPYDLPLTRYESSDEPWCVDLPRSQPDSHGKTWPQ